MLLVLVRVVGNVVGESFARLTDVDRMLLYDCLQVRSAVVASYELCSLCFSFGTAFSAALSHFMFFVC